MRVSLTASGLLLLSSLGSLPPAVRAQSTSDIPAGGSQTTTPDPSTSTPTGTAVLPGSPDAAPAPEDSIIKRGTQSDADILMGVPTIDSKPPAPKPGPGLVVPVPADAEPLDEEASRFELGASSSVLYDARTIGLDRNGTRYLFEGDVVLIGGGYVITADSIDVGYANKEVTASGHVLLIHQNQVFSGDKIFMKWESGDFTIENAVLVSSDPQKIREVSQTLLGVTSQELDYEAAKKLRLNAINEEKVELRESFRKSTEETPSPDELGRYTRLLERELVTSRSSAPSLAQQDSDRRKRFERRRVYWEKSRAEAAKNVMPSSYYFRLEGEKLERKDGNFYSAEDARFTPCICADDESPAWGFQADRIEAQQEGYIDLEHPVLTIKGIPLIYLPFLRLPLKAKRQSGFLMPSFQSGQAKNGFVYTQPVFFEFGPNADTTVTADIFQKRGTRIGAEARYEARQDSGFRYQVETIRDLSWLELQGYRRDLLNFYNVENPPNGLTPEQLQRREDLVKDRITPPSNTVRGKQEWEGRYSLAPRLSVVTKGKMVSDHRYLDDLYLPEDIATAFALQANANAFSTSNARANFGGKDFFAGVRTSYGDNALSSKEYSGQQIEGELALQSRYFRLFPASWWSTPTYGEIRFQGVKIDENREPLISSLDTPPITLGSGNWNRVSLNLVTPLVTTGAVRIDHFAEAELRYVRHSNLEEDTSTIKSWRTGVNFNLPMEGMGRLPDFLQPKDIEGERIGQHIMNWGLSFSTRPVVAHDGPYGDQVDQNNAPLVYFPSDRGRIFTEDQDIRDEDLMVKHKRVTFSTSHRWRFFDRVDEALPAKVEKVEEFEDELDNLQEQARQELMAVKDRTVRSVEEMYRRDVSGRTDWLIRRYRTVDQNAIEPIVFNAAITYDAEQETLRRRQLDENQQLEQQALAAGTAEEAAAVRAGKVVYQDLPESWIGPSAALGLNWRGFTVGTSVLYNIYERSSTSLGFDVGLPTFYTTQFGLRYVLEKSPELDAATNSLLYKKTRTTTAGLTSRLIPYVTVGANLIQKEVDGQKPQYGTSYQIGYDDTSSCWGLRFLREKDLNQVERNANYMVQLAIIFLGNRRAVDVSPGLERAVGHDSEQ